MFVRLLALLSVTVLATLNDVTNQATPVIRTVTTRETVTGSPVTTAVTKTVTPDSDGNYTTPSWNYLTSTPFTSSISSSSLSLTGTSTSESSAASTASDSSSVSTGGAPDVTGGLAMSLAGAAGALGFALAL
ncbi:uncharacterized protein AtWU_03620 [Aspergillus tubingensis]|uniref:uncharacterized protein n=1 Tax=Aspergillus tubingensis TaxID=5068 RepID=UPI001578154B|nr:uncharacterized protein AtWU_03620 [Aspergillus tubingensis]GFN13821.1 hypothetical protein AtWU_03620 [Aspergillus tubingensis]GLB23309.1 hypothetical protein AtubIFM61612_003901 [Aspergillus tubingensis]